MRGNGGPELEMSSLKFHAAPNPGSGSGILILHSAFFISSTAPSSWPEVNYPRRARLQFQSPFLTHFDGRAGQRVAVASNRYSWPIAPDRAAVPPEPPPVVSP